MTTTREDYQKSLNDWWKDKLSKEKPPRATIEEAKQWKEAFAYFKDKLHTDFEKKPDYLADGLSKILLEELKTKKRFLGPDKILEYLKGFEKDITNKTDDELQAQFQINPSEFFQREKPYSPEDEVLVNTIQQLTSHSQKLEGILNRLDYLKPTEAKAAKFIKSLIDEFRSDVDLHIQSQKPASALLGTIDEFKRRISVEAGIYYASPTASAAGAAVTLASAFSALAFKTSVVGGSAAKKAIPIMDDETKNICKKLVSLCNELPQQLSSASEQVKAVRSSESKLVPAAAAAVPEKKESKESKESKEFTHADMQAKYIKLTQALEKNKAPKEDIKKFKEATAKLQTLVNHLTKVPEEYKKIHKGKKEVDSSGIVMELANYAKVIVDSYCKMNSKDCCDRSQGILEGTESHIRVQKDFANKHHNPLGIKFWKPESKLEDVIKNLMTACGMIESQAQTSKTSMSLSRRKNSDE